MGGKARQDHGRKAVAQGTVCFQLHWEQGELWDLGHCRLTSLLGSVFGLG